MTSEYDSALGYELVIDAVTRHSFHPTRANYGQMNDHLSSMDSILTVGIISTWALSVLGFISASTGFITTRTCLHYWQCGASNGQYWATLLVQSSTTVSTEIQSTKCGATSLLVFITSLLLVWDFITFSIGLHYYQYWISLQLVQFFIAASARVYHCECIASLLPELGLITARAKPNHCQ